MLLIRRFHPTLAFCSSAAATLRMTGHRATSPLANAASPAAYPRPLLSALYAAAPRGLTGGPARALRFEKAPSNGSGGGGGWFSGRFGRWGGGDGGGDDGGENGGLFARLVALYTRAVTRRPILTKATSTLLIGVAGDYCAQRIAARRNPAADAPFALNARRLASVGVWSFAFMGGTLHYWYAALDRLFFGRYAVLHKLLCDQLLFAPVFNTAFIAGVGTLEGMQNVGKAVRDRAWPLLKVNWMMWPAAQVLNFSVVPKQWQILYVNCVGFVWTIILTYIAHGDEKKLVQEEIVAKLE